MIIVCCRKNNTGIYYIVLVLFIFLSSFSIAGDICCEEWTFERARKIWKPMIRPIQYIGVPGHQFQMGVLWDGSILSGYIHKVPARRKVMQREMEYLGDSKIHLVTGFGTKMRLMDRRGSGRVKIFRNLEQGRLPIPHIISVNGDLTWHETVFASVPTRPFELGEPDTEEMLLAHVMFCVSNKGIIPRKGHLWMYFGDVNLKSGYKQLVFEELGKPIDHRFEPPYGFVNKKIRYIIREPSKGRLRQYKEITKVEGAKGTAEGVIEWEVSLEPGESAELILLVPNGLIDIKTANKYILLDSQRLYRQCCEFWKDLIMNQGSIITPDPFINDYLAAVAAQMAQQVAYREKSNLWVYKTSPLHYEHYWPCNAARALPTFDLRGLTFLSRKVLKGFIDFQTDDSGLLAIHFKDQKKRDIEKKQIQGEGFEKNYGFLGNFGEWTANTMLMSHGLEMWALASHYRITRDDDWLNSGTKSPLQAMICAFDWVVSQRKRTMRMVDGEKVPHWGLLPAASAHDWLAGNTIFNDAWCIFGMTELVRLLGEIGHFRADQMKKELNYYRACLQARYEEARNRSKPVPLLDGSTIPFVPRVVQELDWEQIDWTYTGYGPLRAGALGALTPDCELVDQTLAFLEAGMPRGKGFYFKLWKDQPNKYQQCEIDMNFSDINGREAERHYLWRHYVEYETMWPIYDIFLKRDDLPRFFEWLFNNLAAVLHHDFRIGVESLDGVVSCAPGDADRWRAIRNMFVNELGGYDGSQQSLWLLQAIPQSWLRPGCKTLSVSNMGTYFGGKVNLNVEVAEDGNSVEVKTDWNLKVLPKDIRIRLRSGDGKKLISAEINGEKVDVLEKDLVMLPRTKRGEFVIKGYF